MMIFLDTDAIIAILRGTPAMGAFLAAHKTEIFAIPMPALFEIYYGFYYPPVSKEFRDNTQFLQRLLREQQRLLQLLTDIQIFELSLDAIKKAAEISARLDAMGTPVGKFDILIAGTLLAAGYDTIVTNNVGHYEKVPEIKVLPISTKIIL
ncbi:MAG: Ribonuclease VapC [Promethearchaeota archaeon CR_4]|nr:MAG: Ribonuclease VapC [Candidatus Lokiarchaeota archaeon CR_4]